MNENQFRKVNESLGKQPGIGPFPAEHIIPWGLIGGCLFYLSRALQLEWTWTGVVVMWGISTWWVLTGNRPWKFLAKFVGYPYWVRGYGRYQRLLEDVQVGRFKGRKAKSR